MNGYQESSQGDEDAPSVFLVTNDARFKRTFNDSDAIMCLTPDEMKKMLEEHLSTTEKMAREDARDSIYRALSARLAEVTDLASAEVAFGGIPMLPGAKLVSIDRFAATKVRSVEPIEFRGASVDFTAKIDGELFYTLQVPAFMREARIGALRRRLRRPRKVGQSVPPREQMPAEIASLEPTLESARASVVIEVDGTATIDGQEVKLEFSGVRHETAAKWFV